MLGRPQQQQHLRGVPPQIKQLHKQFQEEFKKNSPQCESICGKLKLELSKLRNPLLTANGPSQDELLIARDVFELASFVSIRRRDFDGFERHVFLLKFIAYLIQTLKYMF